MYVNVASKLDETLEQILYKNLVDYRSAVCLKLYMLLKHVLK